ncbi:MAG: hypothetical protein CME66_05430 [Halobacteriovoraceae bacterium]|nr:hypothetical protein [Halobacteriovoraceae bacterium]
MEKPDLKQIFSNENSYLIPSYLDFKTKQYLLKVWQEQKLSEHVFLTSSGTTSGSLIKTYALSKKALKANAQAVNEFLNVQNGDSWLCSLPYFHVGGLSIYFRAKLSSSAVYLYDQKWNPHLFLEYLSSNQITYCSVVPTQLFDLVKNNLCPPIFLKGVFVGGDFLNESLKKTAIDLGWPLIQTYGMTETCSQIASSYTQDVDKNFLKVLPIHKLSCEANSKDYRISSPSLYSAQINIDPKKESYVRTDATETFLLPDLIEMKSFDDNLYIKPMGRKGDEVKIKGRLFSFLDLKNSIEQILLDLSLYQYAAVVLDHDSRQGKILVILLEKSMHSKKHDLDQQIKSVFPGLRDNIQIKLVERIKRTFLGKIKTDQ